MVEIFKAKEKTTANPKKPLGQDRKWDSGGKRVGGGGFMAL